MPNLNISIHYESKLWCRQGDHWLKIKDAEYDRLVSEAKWVIPKKIPESWERGNLK